MGNGSVERFNRTLGGMIRALSPEDKADWPRRLQTLTFMYNCTAHETTGYPPFYLMFGRILRLPVDVLFRSVLNDPDVTNFDKYVACLTDDLKEAMVIAQDHAAKEQYRHAQLYNKRAKGSKIDIGDRVLMANRKERGKKKLADRWDSTIYTVVDMNAATHTYRICDTITGQEKVIHRNLLMLANFLPVGDSTGLSDHASSVSVAVSSEGANRTLCTASDSLVDGSAGHSAMTVVEGQSPLTVPEPVDSERRTIEWITQLSTPSQSEVDVADVTSVTRDSDDSPVLSEDNQTYDSGLMTAVDVLRQPDHTHDTVTQADNSPDTLHTTVQTPPMHSGGSCALTQVRSRFGRLVIMIACSVISNKKALKISSK